MSKFLVSRSKNGETLRAGQITCQITCPPYVDFRFCDKDHIENNTSTFDSHTYAHMHVQKTTQYIDLISNYTVVDSDHTPKAWLASLMFPCFLGHVLGPRL